MLLRVRGPNGQTTLSGVEADMSIADLLALIESKTGVPVGAQEILSGFPPRPLDLPAAAAAATVGSLGIQAGDSLTVRQIASTSAPFASGGGNVQQEALPAAAAVGAAVASNDVFSLQGMSEDEQLARAIAASLGEDIAAPPPSAPTPTTIAAPAPSEPPSTATTATAFTAPVPAPPLRQGEPGFQPLPDGRAIARRLVADDNSCLFSAVGLVARGNRNVASSLRAVVAEAVLSDPFEWNEAVLGKDPVEYATWIKDPKKWGGAIELSILSRKLGIEIAAFDIQTTRIDIYGQGQGYEKRIMVVYDGLHYDALTVAFRIGAPESSDQLTIPSSGPQTESFMATAAELVGRYHAARQFTNTATFTLRCGVCKIGLKGEKEAVAHAQETGHTQFSEY